MVDYNVNVLGGLDLGGRLSGLARSIERKEEKERLLSERQELQDLSLKAAQGDPDAIESLFAKNPQLGNIFEQRQAKMQQQEAGANQSAFNDWALKYATADQEQKKALEQEALNDPMIDFDESDIAMSQNQKDFAVNTTLYQSMGKDAYKQFFGGNEELAPGDSVQKSEILPDGTTIQVLKSGVTRVTDTEGNELSGNARVKAIMESRKAGIEEQQKRAAARGAGAGTSKRIQGYIDSGVEAADSVGSLSRAIELLDLVETGGIDAAALKAKQVFGIETADEGELANELGVAVLSQLKPIFGSAFTAQEGQRLERLSAGFGKSPAANKRIIKKQLEIAKRAARRAVRAAREQKDFFTAEEIEEALDRVESFEKEVKAPQAAIDYLIQNPNLKDQFKAKYGYLPEGFNG